MDPIRPFRRLTRRCADERGFTLIELLVVILIVGILAAIALPSFINQRQKGYDTDAKTTLRTALVALTSYQINEGTYNATPADLVAIEPSLADANNLTVAGAVDSFTMTEESDSLTVFTVSRDAVGKTTRDCSAPGAGLCKAKPDAGGNRW
jgi:type IV pilus assembly protein PilA